MANELLGHPAVREALGGSLVAEELRGDFTRARQAASAAGVLEVCLVDSITGRSGAARRRLAEMATAALDSAQQAVVTRLRLFADTLYFTNTPAHTGETFDDLVPRWDHIAAVDAVTGSPAGSVSVRELRLLSVYGGLIGLRPCLEFLGTGAHPQNAMLLSPEDMASATGSLVALLLTRAHRPLSELAEEIDGTSPRPCSQTWIILAEADLFRRAGNPLTALDQIRAQRARCESAGDQHGSALCWLAEGDMRACAIESPMTLGLSPHPGSEINNAIDRIESREHARVSEGELAAARGAFVVAQEQFAEVHAPRGVAAAELRLAGVAALAGDHAEARARATKAESGFSAVGDEAQGHLARIHGALADVARLIPVDVAAIRAIGTWGAGDGDLGYALGLGSLLARMSRRWLHRDAGHEQSIRCAQLAEALLRAAGAPLAAAKAIGDQFNAHQVIRDRAAAFVAARRADDLLISAGPSTMPVVRRRLLLGQAAWSLALAAADAASIEVFALRLVSAADDLAKCSPSLDALTTQVDAAADPSALMDSVMDAQVLLRFAKEIFQLSTTFAPQYRAYDLELDPDASENAREQAWSVAATEAARWPEPQRWKHTALLQAGRGDRASAALMWERYYAVLSAEPASMAGLETDSLSPQLVAVRDQRTRGNAQAALQGFLRMGDAAHARVQLDRLIALDGECWWQRGGEPWELLAHQGDVLHLEGDTMGAVKTYDRACDVLEQQRGMLRDDGAKTAFADSNTAQRLFAHAATAALGLGTEGEARAFDFLERGRGRALADLVSDVRATTGGNAPIVRWREACARRDLQRALIAHALAADNPDPQAIKRLQGELDAWDLKAAKFEAEARAQSSSRFQMLNARAAVAPLREVAQRIPDGVVVIELSLVDRTLLGWALTREGMTQTVQREFENVRLVRRDVRGFLRACADNSRSLAAGQRLAGVLLAPFGDAIRAASQVVFVAAGDLSLVPFHALPFDGDALGAQVSVSYAPSASLMGVLTTRPVAGAPILVVGDPPKMSSLPDNGRPLRALPGARLEAEAIAALVPNSLLLTEDATRARVAAAMSQYRVIHLATHGLADERSPWLSAIMLADSDQLTLSDLMGLELDADLVILSACDSGTGKVTYGDEVLGLARGLLAAGARAVIVSLWPVNDQATRVLMTELHRQLQTGARPADALRDAQLALRKLDASAVAEELTARGIPTDRASVRRTVSLADEPPRLVGYDHPMFWAPFVLIGV
ncbi:MAG: CHAT domain-containing protein [Myxococcales bacterium]|nr:CHAT domain-containing protein [Myxococcales bacterium]